MQQCAATPSLYGLTTFANFSQPRELSEPPPLPSGSRLVLGAARDPAQIPLPDSPDGDLCDPIVIAEARGYTRTTKTAGARRKAVAKAPNGKGKEKENTNTSDRTSKRARAVEDDEDDARTEVKRGRPYGSNNYSAADIHVLLDFVEHERPLGQKGWQAIHSKYSEWASRHGRPPAKRSHLKQNSNK